MGFSKFLLVFQGNTWDLAQRIEERAVLGHLATAMEQQAQSSWIFRFAFLDAQEDVPGYHDGCVGDEGIEVAVLAP